MRTKTGSSRSVRSSYLLIRIWQPMSAHRGSKPIRAGVTCHVEAAWSAETCARPRRCGRGARRTGCYRNVGRNAVRRGAVSVPGESGDLSPHALRAEPVRHHPGLAERSTGTLRTETPSVRAPNQLAAAICDERGRRPRGGLSRVKQNGARYRLGCNDQERDERAAKRYGHVPLHDIVRSTELVRRLGGRYADPHSTSTARYCGRHSPSARAGRSTLKATPSSSPSNASEMPYWPSLKYSVRLPGGRRPASSFGSDRPPHDRAARLVGELRGDRA